MHGAAPWLDGLPSPLALAAGTALAAVCAFTALFFRRGAPLRAPVTCALLLAAGGAALLFLSRRWSLALPPLLLAGACGAVLVSRSARAAGAGTALVALLRGRTFPCWLLAALAVPLGLWWCRSVNDQSLTFRNTNDFLRLSAEDALEEVPVPRPLTDQGRPIPLFQVSAAGRYSGLVSASEAALLGNPVAMEQMIRVAPADPGYNCHGWVFTGGRYWVRGEDVEKVLADNGYRRVPAPQNEDLVVYRASDGRVVHSGVVRTVGRDGLVLVESKWGHLCRFIHAPDCYPGRRTYYRTTRGGHLLLGLGEGPDCRPGAP